MSGPPNAALLFAAGLGTRMAPLTDTMPKPMVPVAGKPLIDHALALFESTPVQRLVANTHYLGEQIAQHLTDRSVLVSHESDERLETGGGLRRALPLLQSDPVITLNTDSVWTGPNPVRTLLDQWISQDMEALLLLVPKENATGHNGKGDFILGADGRITPGPGAVYSGLQIIRTDTLETYRAGAFSMWDIWNDMFARRAVFGALHSGGWCDVGRPESIAVAEDMLRGVS